MYNQCFKNLDTPEKTYWFGFITGDGNIHIDKKQWNYRFNVTLKDKEHVEKLALFLGYSKDRIKIRYNKYFELQLSCKELIKDLMGLGLIPKKSLTVDASIIPKDYQWDFIRGLWDADGCITMGYKKNIKAILPAISLVGNFPLINEIKNIINDGGSLCKRKNVENEIFILYYGGRIQSERILDKIYYSPPYLDRKFELYMKIKEYSIENNAQGHQIREYSIYKNGRSYFEKSCLYCGTTYLVKTDNYKKGTDKNTNKGRFCSYSHARLYYWKLRKGELSYATC